MNKLMTNYFVNVDNKSVVFFRNRTFIAQSGVFILFLINAFRANTIPNIVILAVAIIMPFLLKPVEIAGYIAGFSMVGTGVQMAYVALACVISLLIKSKMRIRIVTVFSILIFVLYELIHLSPSFSDNIVEFFRYAFVYALLFYIMFQDYDVSDKIQIVDSYIYGTIFSFVHVFVETFIYLDGDITRFTDGSFRFGYSQQLGKDLTMAADPNAVGQGCTIIIILSLMMIILGYKNKKYYLSALVAFLVGSLTISKTFLLAMALSLVLVILFAGSWNSVKSLRMRIWFLIFVSLGVCVVLYFNPSYVENILSRVDENDITTGRVANAGIYFKHLSQDVLDLLFGVGMQNVGEKIGFTGSPHSMLVEGLICWGFFGTVAVLLIIVYAIKCNISRVKTVAINWVPLIVYTVIMQTTQLFRLRDRVFTLIVMIVAIGISRKGEN